MNENKMTKRSDLFREYARVIDMCAGTRVSPRECLKWKGEICRSIPTLNDDIDTYEFALAIVEDRPVFKGDVLWTKDSQQITVDIGLATFEGYKIWTSDERLFTSDFLSWQEPKRTITINGKEYPAPNHNFGAYMMTILLPNDSLKEKYFHFNNESDMNSVAQAVADLLNGK